MNQEQLKTQKIAITERTPRGQFIEYNCNGLIDALCKFGSGLHDRDHDAFTNAGIELQEDQNLTAEKIQKCFQSFTENIVFVGFVNE